MSVKVKRIGKVSYDDLDGEMREDVAYSVARLTLEEVDEVKVGLENGPADLPLVLVDPEVILESLRRRVLSSVAVRKYKKAWLRGDTFPPVVIASDIERPLIEGRHRTASAVEAGISRIKAIDLAGVHIKKTKDGLETYGFNPLRNSD